MSQHGSPWGVKAPRSHSSRPRQQRQPHAACHAAHPRRQKRRDTGHHMETNQSGRDHLSELIAEPVLDAAYAWLCRRRQDYPAHADIWAFRRQWPAEKTRIRADLLAGRYTISLLDRITRADGEECDLWAARDALVLKALAMVLGKALPSSRHCTHLKGHGGAKGAVRRVLRHLPSYRFVLKTDVRKYYASIDHHRLLAQVAPWMPDPHLMNLIGQYLKRRAERGGLVWDYRRGIPLGCPLSPILGAFYLYELDVQMAHCNWWYLRYMDDILVLAPTRWKLRQAVRVVNQALGALDLEKASDKTFIGRIEKGFDFLGYHFSQEGLMVAQKTIERFVARATRLYEQSRETPGGASRLGDYVSRWVGWVRGGIRRAGVPVLGYSSTLGCEATSSLPPCLDHFW